jgi:hypothetical protein
MEKLMKNYRQSKLYLPLAIALSSVSFSAHALIYAETTDFPASAGVTIGDIINIGTLDNGINTVSGTLAGNCVSWSGGFDCNNDPVGDTQDSFVLHIANGYQLDSLFATTSNATGPTGFTASLEIFDQLTALTGISAIWQVPLNATSTNQVTIPLGAGDYSVSMFGGQSLVAGHFAFSYSLEFNVTPVPVPNAAWLFASGLAGLVARKRKNKNRVGRVTLC